MRPGTVLMLTDLSKANRECIQSAPSPKASRERSRVEAGIMKGAPAKNRRELNTMTHDRSQNLLVSRNGKDREATMPTLHREAGSTPDVDKCA